MTTTEAIQMIKHILDPDPWEYINWSDKAKEALYMAIEALEERVRSEDDGK